MIVVVVIVGLFQTSWPQASTPGLPQASHPHPIAAGLAKPRVPDARNSWETPTSHSPGSWCLPFPRVGVEWGGGLALEVSTSPAGEEACILAPRPPNAWGLKIMVNQWSGEASSVSESCVCVRRGPAFDGGTHQNQSSEDLWVGKAGYGWRWDTVGQTSPAAPNPGTLQEVRANYGEGERNVYPHHHCSGSLGSEVIMKSLEAQLSPTRPHRAPIQWTGPQISQSVTHPSVQVSDHLSIHPSIHHHPYFHPAIYSSTKSPWPVWGSQLTCSKQRETGPVKAKVRPEMCLFHHGRKRQQTPGALFPDRPFPD